MTSLIIKAEDGEAEVSGDITVSDLQENIAINNSAITGTLKWVAFEPSQSQGYDEGYFLALDLSDNDLSKFENITFIVNGDEENATVVDSETKTCRIYMTDATSLKLGAVNAAGDIFEREFDISGIIHPELEVKAAESDVVLVEDSDFRNITVGDIQEDVSVDGSVITGTLKYLDEDHGLLGSYHGNYLALDLSDNDLSGFEVVKFSVTYDDSSTNGFNVGEKVDNIAFIDMTVFGSEPLSKAVKLVLLAFNETETKPEDVVRQEFDITGIVFEEPEEEPAEGGEG